MSSSEVSETVDVPGTRVTINVVIDVAQILHAGGKAALEHVLDQVGRLLREVRDGQ